MRWSHGKKHWKWAAAVLLCTGGLALCTGAFAMLGAGSHSLAGGVLKIAEGTTVFNGYAHNTGDAQITIVELPASLTEIQNRVVPDCNTIKEYRVSPDNQCFKAVDGVLFTKDGSRLVEFPSARGGAYTLPDGTREIMEGAFRYNEELQELTLCEGITSIKNIFIPYELGIAETPRIRKLRLPSTVQEIEPFSISGIALEEIAVAPNNPLLYDIDGVLFSKEYNELLVYPQGRRQEHYDVPPGTERIGTGAFAHNEHLQSVSMPRSVKIINGSAFHYCHILHSVSLPMTLQEIGSLAFFHCLHLQYVSIPPVTSGRDDAFRYCPLMEGEAEFETVYPKRSTVFGIISPENARDSIAARSEPSASAEVLAQLPSGTTVTVAGREGQFYKIYAEHGGKGNRITGYIAPQDVQICGSLYGVFTPSAGKLREGLYSATYYSAMWILPTSENPQRTIGAEQKVKILGQQGQWYYISVANRWGYIPVNQLTVYTESESNGKTYGVVVNDDLRDRLHLRETPEKEGKSLGEYFSGTQVEILGDAGNWYHVKVGLQEGYMMKQFVEPVYDLRQ